MSTRAFAVTAGLLLLAGLLAVAPAANADRCTCGDLLLPHFEVHLPPPGGSHTPAFTTTFAVGSNADHAQTIRLRLYTNWGIPVLTVNYDLEPRAVLTVNLRDWLINGQLPNETLGADELAHLQAALSGQLSPKDGKYYSSVESPDTMVGFILIEAAYNQGTQSHLFGDIFFLGPTAADARGESMVRLVSNPSREVCEQHILRFLEGGQINAQTSLKIWIPLAGTAQTSATPDFALRHMSCTVWDEAGNEIAQRSVDLLATQIIQVADLNLPANYGWMTCSFSTAAAVFVSHQNSNGYQLALRTFCEEAVAPAPNTPVARIALQKETNGEDADLPPGPKVDPGGSVTWTYEITNTGSTTVVDIALTDDHLGPITCPQSSLDAGESMICTANGTAPAQGDWPYQYANSATVVGIRQGTGEQLTDTDVSHYYVDPGSTSEEPAILLQKEVNGEDADDPPGPTVLVGSTLSWTFEVTNTGNVTLSNVSVVDDVLAGITCPKTTLAVGESMTCSAQSAASEGAHQNIGTATGQSPSGTTVQDTDPANYFGQLESSGDEGCSPGYWKNHPGSWSPTGYSTSQTVDSVFSGASAYSESTGASLLEALSFGGGPGLEGAAQILLRAAVAALLNAAHPGVDYPDTANQVVADVNVALASANRTTMLALASGLDAENNLGCPLN